MVERVVGRPAGPGGGSLDAAGRQAGPGSPGFYVAVTRVGCPGLREVRDLSISARCCACASFVRL